MRHVFSKKKRGSQNEKKKKEKKRHLNPRYKKSPVLRNRDIHLHKTASVI
jgi:hypothetical protein